MDTFLLERKKILINNRKYTNYIANMFKNKEKIIEKVKSLPKGSKSPSGKYWCVTCKKLFELDEPVCPYMPKVCLNSPIAIENISPESTEAMEKFGLFYPKIPQKVAAELINKKTDKVAEKWTKTYLNFLKDWKINYKDQPLQTLKSFIIIGSGCETAQRIDEEKIRFILTDAEKIWNPENLFNLLENSIQKFSEKLGISKKIELDSTSILGDSPMGKYFCPMCRKFFEFSIQRDSITCPLMAQKCMATPTNIDKMNYEIDDLIHVYDVTPKIYKRFISKIEESENGLDILKEILVNNWNFDVDNRSLEKIANLLGIE